MYRGIDQFGIQGTIPAGDAVVLKEADYEKKGRKIWAR
jgi:hypothetical protein